MMVNQLDSLAMGLIFQLLGDVSAMKPSPENIYKRVFLLNVKQVRKHEGDKRMLSVLL